MSSVKNISFHPGTKQNCNERKHNILKRMKHSGSGGNGSRVSVMRLTINHKPEEAEIIVAKKEEKKSGKVNVEL